MQFFPPTIALNPPIAKNDSTSREICGEPYCEWRKNRHDRYDLLVAAFLATVAFAVRLPFIINGDALLHSDEAIVGIMAQDILEGNRFPFYFYGQRYMGALEAYTIAIFRSCCEPVVALRLGPCCYFALLVALQYLLLSRWFGRRAALVGTSVLVASSPMFAQWSIAARGAYIEVFALGTALWWLYSEWFVARAHVSKKAQTLLGAVIGFGLWLNPMIIVFVVPIVVHSLLGAPLKALEDSALSGSLERLRTMRLFQIPILTPLLGIALLVLANGLFTVEVTPRGVEFQSLIGQSLFGWSGSAIVLPCAAVFLAAIIFYFNRRFALHTWLVSQLEPAAPWLFGALLGSLPATFYVVSQTYRGLPLEDTLPLGIRPLASIGEPLKLAINGLPILFGSDPMPFLSVLLPAQQFDVHCAPFTLRLFTQAGGWPIAAGFIVLGFVLIQSFRAELFRLLNLQSGCYSPLAFLSIATTITFAAYLLNAVVFDFSSIRYLLLLWMVLPGLIAAAVASKYPRTATLVAGVFCVFWGLGQTQMLGSMGPPHPLRIVAHELSNRGIDTAIAEFQDAQLISFLSDQQVRVAEFHCFWPRLSHYREKLVNNATTNYVVRTGSGSLVPPFVWNFPGPAPPETCRTLQGKLARWIELNPHTIVARQALTHGFELIILSAAMPEE